MLIFKFTEALLCTVPSAVSASIERSVSVTVFFHSIIVIWTFLLSSVFVLRLSIFHLFQACLRRDLFLYLPLPCISCLYVAVRRIFMSSRRIPFHASCKASLVARNYPRFWEFLFLLVKNSFAGEGILGWQFPPFICEHITPLFSGL